MHLSLLKILHYDLMGLHHPFGVPLGLESKPFSPNYPVKAQFWGISPMFGGISPIGDRQGKIWVDILIRLMILRILIIMSWVMPDLFFKPIFWIFFYYGGTIGLLWLRGGGGGFEDYVILSVSLTKMRSNMAVFWKFWVLKNNFLLCRQC